MQANDDTREILLPMLDLVTEVNGCLEWQGCRDKDGYGRFRRRGRRYCAHRVAWTLRVGPIEDGLFVLHRCDNPPCINVEHLFLGTNRENLADMTAKGRRSSVGLEALRTLRQAGLLFGQRPKLTVEQVIEIRTRYAAGGISQSQLATEFGVCNSNIYAIIKMRSWKQVLPSAK